MMTKKISKIGNSQGIIFDAALLDLARVKAGDHFDVTIIPESGAIVLMPIRKAPSRKQVSETIQRTVRDYRKTLKKLA